MAFTPAALTAEPRSFSIGPWKIELQTYSVASGDTTGTITANALSSVSFAMISGPAAVATALPTYSGNAVTLAYVNPAATRYGTIILFGK